MESDNMGFLKAKINKSSSIFIQSIKDSSVLERPVYAINWFDTKQLWLYNFYNFLGSKSVLKVKGIPFFKGLTQEVIHGDKELRRDVLLIVNYPSCHAFKDMIENLYFQVVSLLRIVAVKSFGFGFFFPETTLDIPVKDDSSVYAFHHFTHSDDEGVDTAEATLKQLKEVINNSTNNATLIFEGGIGAHLYSGDQVAKEQIPCIMDAGLVFKADSVETLKQLIAHDDYQALIKQTTHSFIAVMKRVI